MDCLLLMIPMLQVQAAAISYESLTPISSFDVLEQRTKKPIMLLTNHTVEGS